MHAFDCKILHFFLVVVKVVNFCLAGIWGVIPMCIAVAAENNIACNNVR